MGWIGGCGVLLACSLGAWAQGTDTVYHLHGSVVNGVTGKPVGRALVMSADRRLATMSNSEGNWTLDVHVPPLNALPTVNVASGSGAGGFVGGPLQYRSGFSNGNQVPLLAQRPGYLQGSEAILVPLEANASQASIALRIMPAAAVRGQVIATGQESLRGVQVQLLQRAVEDGRYEWRIAGNRPVEADGSFRIGDLQPGEYTVMTQEWDAEQSGTESLRTRTEQYPAQFLGDVPTLAAATKLHIGYGQTAQADMHLQRAAYYPVKVPVQGLRRMPR